MAEIGRASLLIVPTFGGNGALSRAVNDALGSVDTGEGTSRLGAGISRGLAGSGVAIGAFSALASRAMDAVASHVGDAAARLDTLKNYPVTLQALGYGAQESEASIAKMSDRLGSLPTRLDEMASTVTGLAVITGDLAQATDAGLALNDMLLASGSSTQLASAAMEQFRQMLSKGKPDMQDWKSLVSAMPGQLAQLAQAMLGPTATADDLYAALGGGGADPTVTMGQLLDAVVRLDEQGGEGFASFREQAEAAQGGVQTAMANLSNSVTKGIANVMDAVGRDRIAGVLGDVKGMVNEAFGGVAQAAAVAAPALSRLWDNLSPAIPTVATLALGVEGLRAGIGAVQAVGSAVTGTVSGLSTRLLDFATSTGAAQKATALLGTSFSPVTLGVGAAAAGIGYLAHTAYDAYRREQEFQGALSGVASAAQLAATELAGGSRDVTDYAQASQRAHADVDGLAQSMADYASRMDSVRSSASEQIGLLGQYKSVIDEMAGAGEASADKLALLQWAVDGLNEATGSAFTAEQVLAGSYADEQGAIQDTVAAIDELIAKRQEQARLDALGDMYTETYKAQQEAARELTRAENDLSDAQRAYDDTVRRYVDAGYPEEMAQAYAQQASGLADAQDALGKATAAYNETSGALGSLAQQMGDAAAATGQADDAILGWVSSNALASAALAETGVEAAALSAALSAAGVTAGDLAAVGERDFMSLANACGGSVDRMVASLALYNATPVLDKQGNVTVDDTTLVDAEGNVYAWNGTELLDKDGSAVADDTDLMDAYGNVVTWNGTELEAKSARVSAEDGGLAGLIQRLHEFISLPAYTEKTAKQVNITENRTYNVVNSSVGGHYAMASGAAIPLHADGFIATRATMTDLGVIGEAGAEFAGTVGGSNYVVPLTNRRYSQPFVDVLVDGIVAALGGARGGNTYVVNGMSYLPGSAIASHVEAIFDETLREVRS